MLPVYFVLGLLNIFAQQHNYGIKSEDLDFDVRVRRSLVENTREKLFNLRYNEDNTIKREKRSYSKKIRITDNDLTRYNNYNDTESTKKNVNKYDIFNPNWNYLFNTTKATRNNVNAGVDLAANRRPMISSYPYGYPPGYAPRKKSNGETDNATTTNNKIQENNNNKPYFYNYQNPEERNFAGYVGYGTKFGQGDASKSISLSYPSKINNNATFHDISAAYAPSYTQTPPTNLPTPHKPTENSKIHSLPYTTYPVNGVNNSILKPFDKVNLAQYAPKFDNGSPDFNNGSTRFNNGSTILDTGYASLNNGFDNFNNGTDSFNNGTASLNNGTYAPVNNTNTTVTTTPKIVGACFIMCNNVCPQFTKQVGRICVPDNDDY